MKKYVEIGFGNMWFIRTEIEHDNGQETEHRGIGRLTTVNDEGFKKVRKNRKAFKFLFGIAGA